MEDVAKSPAEQEGQQKKKTIWWIVIGIAVVAIAIMIYIANNNEQRKKIVESGTFHEGIYVGEIALGGLSMEQAKQALKTAEDEAIQKVRFKGLIGDASYLFMANDLGITVDTDAVLKEAFAVGRDGSLSQLRKELEDLKSNPQQFSLRYRIDHNQLRTRISQVAYQANQEPKDAYFDIARLDSPYAADEDGIDVEEEAFADAIVKMVEDKAFQDIEIPVRKTKANLTLDQIQAKIVLRSSASTSFAKSPYNRKTRVFNIKKASGIIHGTEVQPGETFSTNTILGDRTYAGGWKPAPAIVQGRNEDQAGGGVCQVSTTLYQAVLKGNLEIVYRQGHSAKLGYVDGGLDATIDSGRIDFKWKNNTDSPIYIASWVDDTDKTIHFELYGESLENAEFDEIQLSSKRIRTISPPGPTEYRVDPTKPAGYKEVWVKRKSGSLWRSYKTYLKDGVEVRTESIDDTVYRAYAGEIIVGPDSSVVS